MLFAAAISRFASLHDGLAQGFLFAPEFAAIVATDVLKGTHTNPTRHPGWFTSAYFHRPDELASEVSLAGFADVSVLASKARLAGCPTSTQGSPAMQIEPPSFDCLRESSVNRRFSGRVPTSSLVP